MKTWRTPNLKEIKIEELAKIIKAKADSNDITSCSVGGACACATQCNALALYWSCYHFAIGVGK